MPRVRDLGVLATAKGWMLTVGGNGGSKPGVGDVIAQDLTDEELLALLDKVYQYLQDNKDGKERSIRTIERLGVDHLKAAVLGE
jgi:NAD(P)H-nitrite reductase large subunit